MEPDPRSSAFGLAPGTFVGNNEVLRKIATGGMAEIYLVRVRGAAGFEKVMVLKRILQRLAEDPRFVAMFLNEARLAATLRHPNIADVIDVGEHAGSYFFTREYVHGQDLHAIVTAARNRQEPVPLPIALAIVHGVANALHHAHEKRGNDGRPLGLVHRDVSSTNIMVSYEGAVKLLDFGIARNSGAHTTQTGPFENKVPYMSPEQCRSQPLDRRSDLFSLGVIMFELTVGRRPFRGLTQYDVMEQIVRRSAPRPRELVEGYPPELEAIVMRLLEPVPADRYRNGDQVLHDLDAFITKHEQWISSRAVGRYMRELFADQVAAWEHAHQEGVPFAEHIANTVTVPDAEPVAEEQETRLEIPRPVFGPIRPVQRSTEVPVATPAALEESLRAATEPQIPEPAELEMTLQEPEPAVASPVIEPLPPVVTSPTIVESHQAAIETTLQSSPPPIVAAATLPAEVEPEAEPEAEAEAEPEAAPLIEVLTPSVEPEIEHSAPEPGSEPSALSAIIEELAPTAEPEPEPEPAEPEISIEPAAEEPVAASAAPEPIATEPDSGPSVLWGDDPDRSVLWGSDPDLAAEPAIEPDEEAPPPAEEPQAPPPIEDAPAPPKRSGGVLLVLVILIVLAAAGVLAFQWLQADVDQLGH